MVTHGSMLAPPPRWVSLALAALAALSACDGGSVVGGDAGPADITDITVADAVVDVAPVCTATQTLCGNDCVDLAGDPDHCGACATACASGLVCAMGACRPSCLDGQSLCDGRCVNPQTDNAHCGACGTACPAGQVCAMGRCDISCGPMLALCDGAPVDGGLARYCANTRIDPRNCGACGNACPSGNTCVDGACAIACVATQTLCDSACRDLQTDVRHCGACGHACAAGEVCSTGSCQASCGAGLTDCAGGCVSTATDPRHCGACGAACDLAHAAVAACASGRCVVGSCASGYGDCDGDATNGCEANVRASDANNCGGCGVVCRFANAAATCSAGACAMGACAAGFADCDMNPANGCEASTSTDNANCGRCGGACAAGQVCAAGVCAATCGASATNCAGDCVNTATDPTHCGGCDTRCALAHASVNACVGGRCVVGGCEAGFADCDGAAANGCEVNVRGADASNCGGCGVACRFANAAATCSAGACAMGACAAGFADCDMNPANGCEVNTGTDNANCGRCGGACGAGQVCMGGACATSCGAGLTACAGGCTSTSFDPANCGACGTRCALANVTTQACVTGACVVGLCAAGFADCDRAAANGCEVATSTSNANCGACGRACPAEQTCALGACVDRCPSGQRFCAGVCVTTATDAMNCGGCGTACSSGQSCTAGVCVTAATGSGSSGALALATGTIIIGSVRSAASGAAGDTGVDLAVATGFAAGQLVFLHQTQGAGAGAWEVAQVLSVSGMRLTLARPLENTYSSLGANHAQAVVMPQYTTVTITGGTLTAPAWDGATGGILAFVANGAVSVTGGTVDASSIGFRGHARVSTLSRPGEQGEGTAGFGVQSTASNGNGGGGGGRTGCDCCWAGAGGGGGHAAVGGGGSNGGATCQPGGSGGAAVGSPAQTTMFFGGAGANGGADEDGYGSPGANGGGIVYVAAPSITVTGAVRADGQTGQNELNISGCGSGGGGGGAGGAIYLLAPTVSLNTGRVSAVGGVGGDEPGNCGMPGGAGSVGRITLRGATVATGTTTPAYTAVP